MKVLRLFKFTWLGSIKSVAMLSWAAWISFQLVAVATLVGQEQNPRSQPNVEQHQKHIETVNRHRSKEVTPENNFLIPLMEEMGIDDKNFNPTFFDRIGVNNPERFFRGTQHFQPFREWCEQNDINLGAPIPPVDELFVIERYWFAQKNPWQAKHFPKVAKWVQHHEPLINRLKQATTQKTGYYYPLVTPPGENGNSVLLIGFGGPSVLVAKTNFARHLVLRANMFLGENRPDLALDEIVALYRFSSLHGQPQMLIENLVSVGLRGIASECAVQIAMNPDLSEKRLVEMIEFLDKLPPAADTRKSLDLIERNILVDYGRRTVLRGNDDFWLVFKSNSNWLFQNPGSESWIEKSKKWLLTESILPQADHHETTRVIDQVLDEMVQQFHSEKSSVILKT